MPIVTKRYKLPDFLDGIVTREAYVRWLQRKAVAHVRRDRKRGNRSASISSYKTAIHQAVVASAGRDAYTGERLAWTQISTYDNESSKNGRRAYKATFALLPTVDHVGDGTGAADFRVCAWRTNDAKGDLSLPEFVELCRRVCAAIDDATESSTCSPATVLARDALAEDWDRPEEDAAWSHLQSYTGDQSH